VGGEGDPRVGDPPAAAPPGQEEALGSPLGAQSLQHQAEGVGAGPQGDTAQVVVQRVGQVVVPLV